MKIELRWYQRKALDEIQKALDRKQKNIVVEIGAQLGAKHIFTNTIELLNRQIKSKILVVTDRLEVKNEIEDILFLNENDSKQSDRSFVEVETQQKFLKNSIKEFEECEYVVFYNGIISKKFYEMVAGKDITLIIITTSFNKNLTKVYSTEEIVFSYGYKEAINDGYITPAMDPKVLHDAAEVFLKQLLERFGYTKINQVKKRLYLGFSC